jgi:membrane fusion protein YbhG
MNRFVIAAVIAALVVGFGVLVWKQGETPPAVLSGAIEADEAWLGSRVGGRVKEVFVEEGQHVEAGYVLLELDSFTLDAQLAEARACVKRAKAVCGRMASGYREEERQRCQAKRDEAQAAYDEAVAGPRSETIEEQKHMLALVNAELAKAKEDYRRAESLFARNAVARQEYDDRDAAFKVASANVQTHQSRLDLLLAGTRKEEKARLKARLLQAEHELKMLNAGYRTEEVAEAEADYEAALARVDALVAKQKELLVIAPHAGVIDACGVRKGQLVAADAPVCSLINRRRLWVRSYIPESMAHHIRLNQKVQVVVEGMRERRFEAVIAFIGQQAEFVPTNAQTPDKRGQQVFRVKALFAEGHEVLRPGMFAEFKLDE